MSQIYKRLTSSGPIPPEIPTQFDTQINSPSIPAANILNTLGTSISDNYNAGIASVGSSGGDDFYYALTNRMQGSGTTIGAVTADIITFNLGATPGAYKMHFEVVGFDSATPEGLGYAIEASIRSDGATATIISLPNADDDEDTNLEANADWDVIASGNSAILRVTGVAGITINWNSVMTYIFVG